MRPFPASLTDMAPVAAVRDTGTRLPWSGAAPGSQGGRIVNVFRRDGTVVARLKRVPNSPSIGLERLPP